MATATENMINSDVTAHRQLFANTVRQPHAASMLASAEPIDPSVPLPGDYVFGSLTPVLAQLLPESPATKTKLARELKAAGFCQPNALRNLAAVRYVATMASIVGFGALLLLVPRVAEPPVMMALAISAILGWTLPVVYIRSRAASRTLEIERGLPDMLDLLGMCIRQGLTLRSALRRVSRDLRPASPALALELAIVSGQSDIGTLQYALHRFADRIRLPDVEAFTRLLIQADRTGTGIADALSESSEAIRERLRRRASERSMRAAVKLLVPAAICLIPAAWLLLRGIEIVDYANAFFGTTTP